MGRLPHSLEPIPLSAWNGIDKCGSPLHSATFLLSQLSTGRNRGISTDGQPPLDLIYPLLNILSTTHSLSLLAVRSTSSETATDNSFTACARAHPNSISTNRASFASQISRLFVTSNSTRLRTVLCLETDARFFSGLALCLRRKFPTSDAFTGL